MFDCRRQGNGHLFSRIFDVDVALHYQLLLPEILKLRHALHRIKAILKKPTGGLTSEIVKMKLGDPRFCSRASECVAFSVPCGNDFNF